MKNIFSIELERELKITEKKIRKLLWLKFLVVALVKIKWYLVYLIFATSMLTYKYAKETFDWNQMLNL